MTSPEAEALREKLAEMLVQLSGTEEHPLSVDEMRGLYGLFADNTAEPDDVTWTEVDAGGIPAIWADPDAGATDRVVQSGISDLLAPDGTFIHPVPLTNVCTESKSSPRLNCVESATCERQQ